MTPEDYEAAFHGINLPESFELDTGVVVPNTREFIEKSIEILKAKPGQRVEDSIRLRLNKAIKIFEDYNARESN